MPQFLSGKKYSQNMSNCKWTKSTTMKGGTLLFDYFHRSLDEPATPRFLMNLHRAFLERTWRILESHSVFRALPVDTKCRIWSQNTNKASALFICRGEMSSSFVSMQHIVEDLDNKTFMEE